jgi:uncharacterized membrane protein YecN with MAPEG domain
MTIAVLCTALLGLLLFGLGLGVSLTRGSTKTNFGYTPDPTDRLYKMIRAHGNTTEYAPMLAVLMLLVGSRNPSLWVLWVMGIATVSRYLLVAGLLLSPTLDKPHPLRFAGALGTYLCGVALCVAVFLTR